MVFADIRADQLPVMLQPPLTALATAQAIQQVRQCKDNLNGILDIRLNVRISKIVVSDRLAMQLATFCHWCESNRGLFASSLK